MNQIIKLNNRKTSVASVTPEGLFIDSGWTVGIHKDDATEYLNNYNQNPNKGFFKFEGSVILTHKDAKITLTNEEAEAIRDLIQSASDEIW